MNAGLRVAAVASLVIGGCAGSLKPVAFQTAAAESPSRVVTPGDWDDIEAAAIIAAQRAEMAVTATNPGPDETVIELTNVRDEPVRLVARRLVDPAAPERHTVELTARAGRFGDPGQERALLTAMARRLRELHRRDTARVRF
jgi:hypothetical protein